MCGARFKNIGYSREPIRPPTRNMRYTVWSARATSRPGRLKKKPLDGAPPAVGGTIVPGLFVPGTTCGIPGAVAGGGTKPVFGVTGGTTGIGAATD